jgi:hypothetical protein
VELDLKRRRRRKIQNLPQREKLQLLKTVNKMMTMMRKMKKSSDSDKISISKTLRVNSLKKRSRKCKNKKMKTSLITKRLNQAVVFDWVSEAEVKRPPQKEVLDNPTFIRKLLLPSQPLAEVD